MKSIYWFPKIRFYHMLWLMFCNATSRRTRSIFSPPSFFHRTDNNNTTAVFDGVNVRLHVGGHPAESQCKNPNEIKKIQKWGDVTTWRQAAWEIKEILGVDRCRQKNYHGVWKKYWGEEVRRLIGGGEGCVEVKIGQRCENPILLDLKRRGVGEKMTIIERALV